jgi:hypothetical protein
MKVILCVPKEITGTPSVKVFLAIDNSGSFRIQNSSFHQLPSVCQHLYSFAFSLRISFSFIEMNVAMIASRTIFSAHLTIKLRNK